MFKKLEAVAFDSNKFNELLFAEVFPYRGNTSPIAVILSALRKPPLSCKAVIFEREYVDKDYQDEFTAHYGKLFKTYPTRCTRVHFFSCRLPKGKTVDVAHYPPEAYLGFVVLRPTDLQRVGRTIVKPTVTQPDHEFITCRAKFSANLLGLRFEIEGMPFLQQDTQVGACAQASLWMLARYMSKRFNMREYLPAEINQFAKSHTARGRVFPAEKGLTITQMLDALQGMGLSAISYQKESVDEHSTHFDQFYPVSKRGGDAKKWRQLNRRLTAKLAGIAYRYIESGLPVIITTPNHAVVGIGHKYDFNKRAKLAIQRIPSFFVNNDARGPYREMPILRRHQRHESFLDADGVIVVTPHEATLCGDDAEDFAQETIETMLDAESPDGTGRTLKKDLITMRPEFRTLLRDFEFRTYLMPSVEFQQDLRRDSKSDGAHKGVCKTLLRIDYPKYVWITEISCAELLRHQDKSQRRCLGRVITDSTAPKATDGVIALHFADLLVISDRQGQRPALRKIVFESTPFVHKFMTSETPKVQPVAKH